MKFTISRKILKFLKLYLLFLLKFSSIKIRIITEIVRSTLMSLPKLLWASLVSAGKFLKSYITTNYKFLLLIVVLIVGEVLHLLFATVPFYDEGVNMNAPIYYLTNQIVVLVFAIVLLTSIHKDQLAARYLTFGVMTWNIKEVLDELAYMFKINTNVFEINSTFWAQIIFILTVIGGSAYVYSKWKQ